MGNRSNAQGAPGADLGDQDLGRPRPDARDAVQPRDRPGHRAGPFRDLGAELRDAPVEELQVVELLRHEEALVRPEVADEGLP